jgi:hypothetical protein
VPISELSVLSASLSPLFVRSLLLPSLERDPDDRPCRFLPPEAPSPVLLPDLLVSLVSPEELLLLRRPNSDAYPRGRDDPSASDLDAELALLLAEDVAPLADVSALDVPSERLVPRDLELELFLLLDEPPISSVSFSVFSSALRLRDRRFLLPSSPVASVPSPFERILIL